MPHWTSFGLRSMRKIKACAPVLLLILSVAVQAFAFAHAFSSGEKAWLFYDLQTATLLACLSAWLYFSLPIEKPMQKALALFWMLDSGYELFDMILLSNTNNWQGLIAQNTLFALLSLNVYRLILQANKYRAKYKFSEDLKGVYIAIKSPTSVGKWLYFIFGISVGSISVVIIDENGRAYYRYSSLTGRLSRTENDYPNDLIFVPTGISSKHIQSLAAELNRNIGSEFSIYNNCAAVFFPILEKYGVKKHLFYRIPKLALNPLLNGPHSSNTSKTNG